MTKSNEEYIRGFMRKSFQILTIAVIPFLISCASSTSQQYPLEVSYLQQSQQHSYETQVPSEERASSNKKDIGFRPLPSLSMRETTQINTDDLAGQFSSSEQVEIVLDELPLKDFLHYVMGEVLKVNYILGDNAKNSNQTVTLNIQQKISKQKLFILTEELLAQKNFLIRFNEEVFFINSEESSKGKLDVAFGYGKSTNSVPNTTADIVQIVPFTYGIRGDLAVVLPKITSVQVTVDYQQNSVMLKGKQSNILQALDFIQLIDTPAYRNQVVGAFKSTFVPVKELVKKLGELLKNDGFNAGLSSVTMDAQGTLIMFSSDKELMRRAQFWLETLDIPAENDEKQYFVFQPLYARATDLTGSLAPLLGEGKTTNNYQSLESDNFSNQQNTNERKQSSIKSAGNENISIVVDERSNSLIINASGKDYRTLLPLIERLDVLPKQVMLEVMIAEVTLRDEFKQGVEFFLNNNNYTLGNVGAFGEGAINGLSYALTGSAKWDLNASLRQTNSLINVISRPSLVVRDGVTARMQVGTEIPIVSSISGPDMPTTTSVQYRKTGLTLSVTPTVNSRGVVIMEINQQISNILDEGEGITAEGAPSIFDRSMKTEVVANSGQTVVLGGLISENNNNSETNVPGLSKIPILGNLFSSKNDAKEKTELVIMVTPRIIESAQQWRDIKASMSQQLKQIVIESSFSERNN